MSAHPDVFATRTDAGGSSDAALVVADDLHKRFGGSVALSGLSLEIRGGEVIAILGPSGSGKSTLLLCLAGIVAPDEGEVRYRGRSLSGLSDAALTRLRRDEFGFVFQFGQLVPELTALDNVSLPLRLAGLKRRHAESRARGWLDRLEVSGEADKRAGEMSGGQAQRVAVARALVTGPRVVFADEPTGSLDSLNGELVMELMVVAARDQGATVVLVTHEPRVAAYADREVVVRDGRIEPPKVGVKSLRLVGLGVRAAWAGGTAGVVRVLLMSIGLAVGVALLLGALSVGPAISARHVRDAARDRSSSAHAPNGTFVWSFVRKREGGSIEVNAVRGRGQAPIPPGIPGLPAVGEVYASPALVDLLAGPEGSSLAPLVGGRVIGTIDVPGLLDPGELIAYTGAPAEIRVRPGDWPATRFGGVRDPGPPLSLTALIILVVFVVGMLLPIAIFVVAAVRLAASTRETRLAAIRLAGATQGQVRLLAGAESVLPAAVACVLAWPLFLLGRWCVAGLNVAGYRWFPSDFRPPVAWLALVLVGFPLFAVAVTMIGMHRLVVSPLGIVRGHRSRRRLPIWPALLAGGLLSLAVAAVRSETLARLPSPIPGLVIFGALTTALVGLAGTAGWVGWSASGAIARRSLSPSWLLGARRLESDPSTVGRVVSALAVMLAVVGVAQAIALTVARDSGGPTFAARWTRSLPASSLYVRDIEGKPNQAVFKALGSISGVRSVHLTGLVPYGGSGPPDSAAVVGTDGSGETLQRVRVVLAWQASVDTFASLHASGSTQSAEAIRFGRMMQLITILVFLVTAAGLLVTTVDGMMERRRPLAVLSAIGVPGSVLRRSVAVQLGVPLVTALILGSGAALAVTALLFRAIGERAVVPVAALTITAGAAVVMVGLVTAVSLPWVRISRRPELLRNE